MNRRRPLRAGQRGLSLVELMVGIAIGLFVLAAATLIVTTQLNDNRLLLLETQLQQDLRASADIITRELRRAGSAGGTTYAQEGIWQAGSTVTENPYTDISPTDPDDAGSTVDFVYRRRSGDEGPYGFKVESGVLKTRIGGGYQELTDAQVMNVTDFTVTPLAPVEYQIPCPRNCPDGSTDCWPKLLMRAYTVSITAQARADASIQRTIRSQVRLRNDTVQFNDPGVAGQACPA